MSFRVSPIYQAPETVKTSSLVGRVDVLEVALAGAATADRPDADGVR